MALVTFFDNRLKHCFIIFNIYRYYYYCISRLTGGSDLAPQVWTVLNFLGITFFPWPFCILESWPILSSCLDLSLQPPSTWGVMLSVVYAAHLIAKYLQYHRCHGVPSLIYHRYNTDRDYLSVLQIRSTHPHWWYWYSNIAFIFCSALVHLSFFQIPFVIRLSWFPGTFFLKCFFLSGSSQACAQVLAGVQVRYVCLPVRVTVNQEIRRLSVLMLQGCKGCRSTAGRLNYPQQIKHSNNLLFFFLLNAAGFWKIHIV